MLPYVFKGIWLKRAISAILKRLIHINTIRRQITLQAVLFLSSGWHATAFAQGILPASHPINLLAPLDDKPDPIAPVSGQPFVAFQTYFARSWPWIVGVAAGIAVLQALIGGIQIMLSGSDSGARGAGKERLMWALAGLLLIGLSGLILQILNPTYYYQ